MEFMAGTGMTEEKLEALGRVAKLCEEQQYELAGILIALERAASEAQLEADRVRRCIDQRAEAKAAVEEKMRDGRPNAALADVSNGNWYAVKAAERAAEIAESLGSYADALKEDADATAAEVSDILYHLTN